MRIILGIILFAQIFMITSGCSFNEGDDCESTEYGVADTSIKTNCTCGKANKENVRIINGRQTKSNEYPLMAGLVDIKQDVIVCGATIITRRHVLTAAHCTVPYKPIKILIHVGYHRYLKDSGKGQILKPKKFFEHSKYEYIDQLYDISIILIKGLMNFGDSIGPACLPTYNVPLVDKAVKVLGWGETSFEGNVSEILQKVYLQIIPLSSCDDVIPGVEMNDVHQLCTFSSNKDSCRGDSGGPLLWRDPDTNKYTVVGVVSRGLLCARNPALSSDVFYFLPWIQEVISNTTTLQRTCAKVMPEKNEIMNENDIDEDNIDEVDIEEK